jgi:hypothetical protein
MSTPAQDTVTLELGRDDATAIAEALEYLAGVDEGEHTDHGNLVRLADLVYAGLS